MVAMSEAVRLTAWYSIDSQRVVMIPHGASTPTLERLEDCYPGGGRPQLLTWGLLGPGKGIEHAIDALALLGDLRHSSRYTVAGVTHPKVFARHGGQYGIR